MDKSGTNAPYSAQENAYKAAMWGGFALGILGTLLAALFLRGVGIVGHNGDDDILDEETTVRGVVEYQGRDGEGKKAIGRDLALCQTLDYAFSLIPPLFYLKL